ncbi:MAG: glycosyltransferase [Pseudomonadota bacterium]
MQQREEARLGEILLAHGMVAETDLFDALGTQWQTGRADLDFTPPPPDLIDAVGAARCLALGSVPWRRMGTVTAVATARPERFEGMRPELEAALGPVVLALATEIEVDRAVARARGPALARAAELQVPADLSCRNWDARRAARLCTISLFVVGVGAFITPVGITAALAAWAVLTLAGTSALKATALWQGLAPKPADKVEDDAPDPAPDRPLLPRAVPLLTRAGTATSDAGDVPARAAPRRVRPPETLRLPIVSIMVPLYREEDIASRLLERLSRLVYPRELTDIVLLTEAEDHTTAQAIARAGPRLPRHIRVLTVPPGTVRTKPRALNYGLSFCRGQIVGIWDAEDAPAPDQLHRIVEGFARRGPEIACLQGVLDFYNPKANWMARCFTLEYAMWFRAMLPGLQALRMPIPLGGTTLFFRRAALEALSGWDAHNVTEDADLGIRLARAGFRTEMVDTVTREEANCRPLAWVKQRSRWLKGYAMTYANHMRSPRALWRDLGPWGFVGFNILFLGTLSQFVLAPLLWSFWALLLGLPHPLTGHVPAPLAGAAFTLFLVSEGIGLALAATAAWPRERRALLPWIPALQIYFPLAALAAYKALWEMIRHPFYWDKTAHGLHDEAPWERARARALRIAASARLPELPIARGALTPSGRAVPPARRRLRVLN